MPCPWCPCKKSIPSICSWRPRQGFQHFIPSVVRDKWHGQSARQGIRSRARNSFGFLFRMITMGPTMSTMASTCFNPSQHVSKWSGPSDLHLISPSQPSVVQDSSSSLKPWSNKIVSRTYQPGAQWWFYLRWSWQKKPWPCKHLTIPVDKESWTKSKVRQTMWCSHQTHITPNGHKWTLLSPQIWVAKLDCEIPRLMCQNCSPSREQSPNAGPIFQLKAKRRNLGKASTSICCLTISGWRIDDPQILSSWIPAPVYLLDIDLASSSFFGKRKPCKSPANQEGLQLPVPTRKHDTRCVLRTIKITSLRVIPTVTSYWHIFVTNPDIHSLC